LKGFLVFHNVRFDKTHDHAEEILQREEMLRLSVSDARTFLSALESPPAPSTMLLDALQADIRLVKSV